jgi:hypothetical protein
MKNSVSTFRTLHTPECNTCPQIPSDEETQVWHHVSVLLCFLSNPCRAHPSMKYIVLTFHAPDATECTTSPVDPTGSEKTSSASRVLVRFLSNPYQAHQSMKNSVSMFFEPYASECTTSPTYLNGCKNTSSASHFLVHFLLNPYHAHRSMKNYVSMFHAPDATECTT